MTRMLGTGIGSVVSGRQVGEGDASTQTVFFATVGDRCTGEQTSGS